MDAICDGVDVVIGGIMEQSSRPVFTRRPACSLPPLHPSKAIQGMRCASRCGN